MKLFSKKMLKETFTKTLKNQNLLIISNSHSRFKKNQFIEFIKFNDRY